MQTRVPIRGRMLIMTLSLLLPIAFAAKARADVAPEVRAAVNAPAELGEGAFRWFGLKVYDAQLFTPRGRGFDWERPFALQLDYARKVRSEILLQASMDELARMEGARADHADIRAKLSRCLRDLKPGDRVVSAPRGANALDFWVNGTKTCRLQHAGIRDRYMAIWLSENARDQALARKLRGAAG